MDLGLHDKIVLVTGSSSGAGQVTAATFGAEGARVVVDYHSDSAGAQETANKVEAAGGQAMIVQGDVTSPASMAALVAEVAEKWGPIQVLVNNAVSFESGAPLEELSGEKLDKLLNIVVRGAIHATAACLPGMKAAGWGRIVNITSRSAIMGYEKMSHYSAAKSALVGLDPHLGQGVWAGWHSGQRHRADGDHDAGDVGGHAREGAGEYGEAQPAAPAGDAGRHCPGRSLSRL